METDKIINGFCYKHSDKIIHIDLISEKTTEYYLSEFKDFIYGNDIDETYMILTNKEGSFVTPLFKYSCLDFLKKKSLNRMCDFSKDYLIDICYKICIDIQKQKRGQ